MRAHQMFKPLQPDTQPTQPGRSPAAQPSRAVPSLFPGRQWQQVLARDQSADGQFFYAVRSTGIYCRPSCPSRRPARKSVTFFPTAAAAEQAGYRPCKRCEPDRAIPRPDPQAAVVAAAAEYLAAHAGERTRLADLAKAAGVGRLALLRGFRRVLGVSPGEFAKAQRVARFQDALRPDALRPDALRPDALRPDALRPDALRPDALRPDALRPDALRPDALRPDALRPADPPAQRSPHRNGSPASSTKRITDAIY